MNRKYEKFIVITLIFIMLFNIFQVKKVEADMDNITKAGLIAFLITMNIYNVATNTTNAIMTLFNDFWSEKTNSEQNEFVNNFKSVWKNSFTSGIMSVVSIPMIHSWIRENFSKGYGNYSIIEYKEESKLIINIEDVESKYYYIYNLGPSPQYSENFIFSIGGYQIIGEYIGYDPDHYDKNWKIYYSDGTTTYAKLYSGTCRFDVRVYSTCIDVEYGTNMNLLKIKRFYYNEEYNPVNTEDINIMYYAGESVDYPMEKEVEDKYIPLPVPDVGMGIPGLDYDVDGNRVFDGTVDEFLDGALGNADYLDSTIDKLLEGGYSTSLPNVNVNDGTITWPATGSVAYPDTGVIDYPDVTIPEGVEEGIGETNSILQGIGSFVESMFSAPTVELDLSPLTNVNLKEKFPFCLPFDLSSLITGLKVDDAEVPNIELNFEVLNDEYTIPLNFEIFSDWAIIVNWFVLILFIVGLIMISRKLIGG